MYVITRKVVTCTRYNYKTMEIHPSYFSIIPAEIKYNRDITDFAKILYGEIMSLSNDKGYCYATNQYFADLYGKDKDTISKTVASLKTIGVVSVEIVDSFQRKIYPLIAVGVRQNNLGGSVKTPKGIDENVDNNNKYNNKENNNITSTSKKILVKRNLKKRKTFIESMIPEDKQKNFNFDELIKFMGNHDNYVLNILAYFVYLKDIKADTWGEAKHILGRHTLAAQQLKDFPVQKIKKEMGRLNRDMPREFTLETVYKYLTK